jgi:hypothetical protein
MLILLLIFISEKKIFVSAASAYIIQLILLKNDRGMQRRAEHLCAVRQIKNKVTSINILVVVKMGLRDNIKQETKCQLYFES